ncbi:Beta-lactamase superfamily domain-containing protein [Gracilibacillus orientalis]|uniref:Beta-lactamase superfamily domain-containing protein n=1 Tax=Gracilibacillus orientalis TaxID=334253 RepID=A0A1I4HTE5_9BACI|nr:MBL fold metallo-hydrolase [Gracilibacillus orientalis]SFL45498.1 Beta-lactamase superfamily domain-containing protein [Gracilibacillus orientalis]
MIDVTVLGGVGEYGRNCFLVTDQATNTRIMLDCGVRNGNPELYPPITEEIAQSIQAVFISHVHNDHTGALPLLAEKGFTGDVWMSEASLKQLPTIIPKWQEKAPHTSIDDLHFRSFPQNTRGKRMKITEDLSITWGYSGHMLGSVWYTFYLREQSIFYSGDIALASPLLVTDMPDKIAYDIALIDSGHGAQTMSYENSITNIVSAMKAPSDRYLIPITISGKACDLLFSLFKALPDRNFFIDNALYEHLLSYLTHTDNIYKETMDQLKAMLESRRLQIKQGMKKAGVYLLLSSPSGFHEIKTSVYKGEHSPFYKSHPDQKDVKALVRTIDAKKYIFFHSKHQDLETILHALHSENYFIGGFVR